MEQRTPEWYKARLGHITSSMVYVLMSTPRKKEEVFTDTAKNYLYQLAAERQISPIYLNVHFDEWLERNNIQTFAMRYGTETEELARQIYELGLPDTQKVEEYGFVEFINGEYGDSPDGLVIENGKPVKAIEIKCPNSSTFVKYKSLFAAGKSLKEIEEKYYWQCLSHMVCNEVDQCDFIFFDKMLENPTQVVTIERDEADAEFLLKRVKMAIAFIDSILE